MPLRGKRRILGHEIIDALEHFLPVAHWAAMPGPAGINRSLPFVPLLTTPPDTLMSARADCPRGQGLVFHRVPLCQEGEALFVYALLIEADHLISSLIVYEPLIFHA